MEPEFLYTDAPEFHLFGDDMRKFFLAALVLMMSSISVFAFELVINNKSEYDIHELYVSKSKSSKWGPDQLGDDQIDAGEKYRLRDVTAGVYELKVVDEDGTECTIEEAEFDESKEWTITSKMLERCDKFGH